METFLSIHEDSVLGVLTTYDRMIFKGHLTMLYPNGAFSRLLNRQGVLLKDFKAYVENASQQVKQQAMSIAEAAGRPYRYLESARTARKGKSKEDLAKQIAADDNITDGLVCVCYRQ